MEKYQHYKNSNVQWLGEIPEHWEVKKLKYIFSEINERSSNGNEELLSVSQYTGVTLKRDKVEEGGLLTNAETLEGYKKVAFNDLVSNIMLAWNGSLGFSPYDGITSPAYCIYRLQGQNVHKYFHYLLRTDLYKAEFKRNSSGVIESRLRLYSDDFFRISAIIPPLSEQHAIAAYLDEKTAQLDTAIAQKQRMIALLKERRQVLIQQAVTQGIQPNVPKKHSGVEWIGEIPEHWEVKRLKYVAEMLVSNVDKHTKPLEIPVKLCNYVDVYKNDFITNEINFMSATAKSDEIKRFKIKIDDVIITKDSEDWLDIGVPSLVKYEEENLICGYHLAILRPEKIMDGSYFYRALLTPNIKMQFSIKANGVTRYGISHNTILGTWIPVPPISEQIAIATYLETMSAKIATAIRLKELEIEQLKAYKGSLINAAVTGKVKVG
jgi:type I restriction enzyme, S subunit